MNKVPGHLAGSRALDIGAEPDFVLGDLSVFPSLREVGVDGRRETVEPRVMQVLVALVRAGGAVVSRDRLIESCWGGRLVGDDAINSCVAKVRALAASTAPPAFEIETIPRVGYRLRARSAITQAAGVAPAATEPVRVQASRRLPVSPWMVAAGICLVVAVAGLAWWFLRPDTSLNWVVVESHQPFVGTSLIERYPAISPDGTMLAYSAGTNLTNRQIYLRIIKGDSSLQLTHETFDATSPAWSPDGTTLAYSVFQGGHPCRIMEMDIPSGTPHQIGSCRTAERAELTFEPSGQALVYPDSAAAGMPARLVRFDLQNGKVTPLTDPPKNALGDNTASFSPDGRYFVYDRDFGDFGDEIRLRRISDGAESVVRTTRLCSNGLAWTPDGTAILMSRSCMGAYSLWATSLDGKTARQIFASPGSLGRLSVNANGYMAMETDGGHSPILAFKPNSSERPVALDEASGISSLCADFAPDGTLAITGYMGSKFGVWIADREGAPFRKLMSMPAFSCGIRWSPDGTRFAFIEAAQKGSDVIVLRRNGESVARISVSAKEQSIPAWTADGRSLLTGRLENPGWRIWRTNLTDPSKSVPITPFGWLSPLVHGSMLFAMKDGAIGTWRLDSGKPVRVAEAPMLESSDLITISGDRFYFADLSDPKHPAIASQSVYGGERKRLMPLPFGTVNFVFAVNPKSGDIVFSPQPSDNSDIGLVRLQKR